MKTSVVFRFIAGILLIFIASLVIFNMMMAPPLYELGLMALFLGITAFVSALAGYIAYRFGWISFSPTLRWSLLGGYALSSLLTFFNVWFSLFLPVIIFIFALLFCFILFYFICNYLMIRDQCFFTILYFFFS